MNVNRLVSGALMMVTAMWIAPALAGAAGEPSVVAVPGKPTILLGTFELGPLGYQVDEFFIAGAASSYTLSGEASADGQWNVMAGAAVPYTTRIVVVRPSDAKKFSGTVVVEWMNVSAGIDVPVDWVMSHREIVRRGHAYVGVTAQKVGIEGGRGLVGGLGLAPLKKADPQRYGPLNHPGDAYSFDVFSQAGRVLKDRAASKVLLGPLHPERVIAIGESQSAFFLTTYATAIDPVAKVYDGILIHSRAALAAPLHGNMMLALLTGSANAVKLRPDLRVPVLTIITETDLVGFSGLTGYRAARQPDTDRLRVWEIAGTSHADNYTFGVGFIDSGSLPVEQLAEAFAPTTKVFGGTLDKPINCGPQQHYVVEAAIWQLDRWVKTGQAPPKAPPLKLADDKAPRFVVDANGLAQGGIRTPWVDVPTARLSGVGNSGGLQAAMVGVGEPFDAATLKRLYPKGKTEYLERFGAALDQSIEAGFVLPDDKAEIMALAAASYRDTDDAR